MRRILVSFDQFCNVLFGGDNEDETISSAVGRKALEGRRFYIVWEAVINLIFAVALGERDHCFTHIEWDEF